MKTACVLPKKLYNCHFIRYTTVGAVNAAVIFSLFFLCNELLGAGAVWSNRVGYAGGLICHYTLNKLWTFKSQDFSFSEILLFLIAFSISYAAQFLIFRLLIDKWGWRDGVAAILANPLYGLIFYFLCKYMVFTGRHEKATSKAV